MKRYTPKKPRRSEPTCRCITCRDKAQGLSTKQAAKNYLDKIEGLIDTNGVAIQHVMGSPTEAPFSYTVGLFLHDRPEFIMFGAPAEHAQVILNHLAVATRDHGTAIEPGDTLVNLLEDLPAGVIGVDNPGGHLATAFRIRGRRSHARRPIRALQIALPDAHGLMPWEAGYSWTRVPLLSDRTTDTGRIVEMPDIS